MSKYEELKSRIEKLNNGWDKEADDILTEMKTHYIINCDCYPYTSCWRVWSCTLSNSRDTGWSQFFNYSTQCEKMSAFRQALLWLLNHSNINKDLVGTEQKVEIEGKVYKARILEKI